MYKLMHQDTRNKNMYSPKLVSQKFSKHFKISCFKGSGQLLWVLSFIPFDESEYGYVIGSQEYSKYLDFTVSGWGCQKYPITVKTCIPFDNRRNKDLYGLRVRNQWFSKYLTFSAPGGGGWPQGSCTCVLYLDMSRKNIYG